MKDLNIENCLSPGNITATSFEDKNRILTDKELQSEAGFTKTEKGDYLVSMVCPMPNVTREMIDWWFWWHPQKSERYRMWYPGEHFAVYYSPKDRKYFKKASFDTFKENTQYPIEKIGSLPLPLSIDFKDSENFGFSKAAMAEGKVKTIVCGTVGAFFGLVKHTQMAHIFFEKEDGLYLVSRFWIGEKLKNPLFRKIFLNDKTARDMARHCYYEYRRLASLLPKLKNEMLKGDDYEG